jgi:hypothetical protein
MSDELKTPDGWAPLVSAAWLEALHCRYSDGQDVIVSIHQAQSGYEVRERPDVDGSAPNERVMGIRESLAAARELMIKTCVDWDSWKVRRSTLGCN